MLRRYGLILLNRRITVSGYKNMSTATKQPLLESNVPDLPSTLLKGWIEDATQVNIPLPTVGSLATASLPSGRVSNRMVNVKEVTDNGNLILYSDFNISRKGHDIASNSSVALTFYWQQLDRSVRLEGTISLLSKEQSRPYFESRSKDFQASVLVGEQSRPVDGGRPQLVAKVNDLLATEGKLEIPDYWVGAEIIPDWIEFWQGNSDRISDRIAYTYESGQWTKQRLSP